MRSQIFARFLLVGIIRIRPDMDIRWKSFWIRPNQSANVSLRMRKHLVIGRNDRFQDTLNDDCQVMICMRFLTIEFSDLLQGYNAIGGSHIRLL